MASPEIKEGQKPLVEKKNEFAEVPENLRDSLASVDVQRTPTPGVKHKGEYLVRPTVNDYEIPYTKEELERMRGGSPGQASTWLGVFFERARKIMESIGRRVIYGKGTA